MKVRRSIWLATAAAVLASTPAFAGQLTFGGSNSGSVEFTGTGIGGITAAIDGISGSGYYGTGSSGVGSYSLGNMNFTTQTVSGNNFPISPAATAAFTFSDPGGGIPAFLARGGQRNAAVEFVKTVLGLAASPAQADGRTVAHE